jgi:branched-chain amino acid transport system substrate-binding protein
MYIVVVVVLIIIIGFVSSGSKEKGADDIIIGAPLSFTGSAAVDALNIKRGVDMAVKDLAAQGVSVKVVYEDDGTDPKRTISAVNKLVSVDKVQAIIGPTWGYLGDAASATLDKAKLVSFAPANTSEFSNAGKYAFYGATKNAQKRSATAEWLVSQGAKRVAIIVDKSGWGLSNEEAFKLAIQDAGAEAVVIEEIPFGQEESLMPSVFAKIRAAKADSILMTGYDEGVTLTIKRSQEMKAGLPILFATQIFDKLIESGTVHILPTDNFSYLYTEYGKEFVDKFKSEYGEEPGLYADRAYDGLMILVNGLQKKDVSQDLSGYIRSHTKHVGFAREYSFDEKGDIKGGEWIVSKIK